MTPQMAGASATWTDWVAIWTRGALMDFGLGPLFERFEGYFGVRAAKALTLLVASALAVVCLNFIYTMAFLPAWSVIQSMNLGQESERWFGFYKIVVALANFLVFVLFAAGIANSIQTRRDLRASEELLDSMSSFSDDVLTSFSLIIDDLRLLSSNIKDLDSEAFDRLIRQLDMLEGNMNKATATLESHRRKKPDTPPKVIQS